MRYINPTALFLVAFGAVVGALAGNVLIGLAVTLGIILAVSIF